MSENNELYTIKEATKILRISRPTLDVWKKKGILKVIKIGGRVLIKKSELLRVLKENERK